MNLEANDKKHLFYTIFIFQSNLVNALDSVVNINHIEQTLYNEKIRLKLSQDLLIQSCIFFLYFIHFKNKT